MRVLVLGGNGFVGIHLVNALHKNGEQVRVYDKRPKDDDLFQEDVDYIVGDFSDTFVLAEALAGIDVVYHLISTTVPSTSNLNIANDIQSNLVATTNLLQTMVAVGVKKIVFLSSGGTVYGNPIQNPIRENDSLQPICSYGIVKIAIEKYLFLFNQLHGIEYNILRVSNPYGHYQQHFGVQGIIPTFMTNLLNNKPITVWGDGRVERDYIYISDVISACIKASERMHNDIFNIGSGKLTSIKKIIDTIENIAKLEFKINYLEKRNFDVKSISLDIIHAERILKWTPEVDLAEGILKHWNWLNSDTGIK